jgi:carbon storage regulator
MLVLSRKKDEKLVVGGLGELYVRKADGVFEQIDPIVLMVIEIRGDKVRLGYDADRNVSVHREEVLNAIKRERKVTA